ncbi:MULTISPECIES: hypothetical protein [Aequorivita]|uniref:Fibronectin type-III domain-containing protein n=1 Tax=Aequorivita iocasae TaxID=2803865 RepID=A0ABX7DSE1_9FLAO|nr:MULTISPECIES: hypothetical protein [Aequorivita]QQX76511.1 hypothetical protein JK629_14480 [Aequorivita iocasae]UCA55983.1 hypothetical protein LDL78_14550 [Aequorivita sp. F7]
MKKNSSIIGAVFALFLLFSCDDILEKDISDMQLTVISPNEGDTIAGNTVQFLWNTIEGANNYTIQIYNNNLLVMDTLISAPPYIDVLASDSYQWRIKGENEAYETQYNFPINFEVISSTDLTNQAVILNSPSDNVYTNESSIIFSWSSVPSADSYTFELLRKSSSGTVTVDLQEGLFTTTVTLDENVLDRDSEYIWRVKAVNETSQTIFFSRTFFIDTVPPPVPSLISPKFEEEFDLTEIITFSWDFGNDPGIIDSAINSVYEIATNSTFSNVIESGVSFPTTITYTFNESGTYYWRVRGEDAAGNVGSFNSNGKLIVNE